MDESGSVDEDDDDNDDDDDDSGSNTVGAATIGVGGISLASGMKVDATLSIKPNENTIDPLKLLKELGNGRDLGTTSYMRASLLYLLGVTPKIPPLVSGKMTESVQTTKLQAALTVIRAAQGRAANQQYQIALEKYELALGALIPLLQNEVTFGAKFFVGF